jgi:hypothetical protein
MGDAKPLTMSVERLEQIEDDYSMCVAFDQERGGNNMPSESVSIGDLLAEVKAIHIALANAEQAGRRALEERIANIVATSRGMGLSRGTCESLCDELADETDEEWLAAEREDRNRVLAAAEAAARADERARCLALVQWEIDAWDEGDSIGERETLEYLRAAIAYGKVVPKRDEHVHGKEGE